LFPCIGQLQRQCFMRKPVVALKEHRKWILYLTNLQAYEWTYGDRDPAYWQASLGKPHLTFSTVEAIIGEAFPGELRAVKVIPNKEAQQEGFTIPTNMRVPVGSVVPQLFEAERLTDDDGQECVNQWELQSKTLPRRAVVVEGRKVADPVIAIVQPVEAKR